MNLINPRRVVLFLAIVIVACFALVLISRHVMNRVTVLRSYSVAPEITQEMRNAIGEAIVGMGRVSIAADGHLLVTAPLSVQRDVQAILQEVAANKPGPTPAISFEVWLVSAVAAPAAKAENAPGLAEIASALDGIQKAQQGSQALHFNLLEKLSVQVRAGGSDSHIGGLHAGLQISNVTLRRDSKGDPVIAARIELNQLPSNPTFSPLGNVRAVVELPARQLLVLGQSNLPGLPVKETTAVTTTSAAPPPKLLYYIVRASL